MAHQPAPDRERRIGDAPQYGDVNDAAKLLDVSASFLNKLRCSGDGPPYVKFGFHVRYNIPALLAWAESRTRRSTSDPGEAA